MAEYATNNFVVFQPLNSHSVTFTIWLICVIFFEIHFESLVVNSSAHRCQPLQKQPLLFPNFACLCYFLHENLKTHQKCTKNAQKALKMHSVKHLQNALKNAPLTDTFIPPPPPKLSCSRWTLLFFVNLLIKFFS